MELYQSINRVVLRCIFSVFILRQSRKDSFLCSFVARVNTILAEPQQEQQENAEIISLEYNSDVKKFRKKYR